MKTFRQSTLAIVIALVSTAAFGPGTFFPMRENTAASQPRSMITPFVRANDDFRTLIQLQAGLDANDTAGLLLAMDTAEEDTLMAIDFRNLPGHGPMPAPGDARSRSDWSALAGTGAGGGAAHDVAGFGAPAMPAMQLARRGGALSGFSASTEENDPAGGISVIALDDPAIVDQDIQQLPASFVSPTPAGLDGRGETTDGTAGGNVVPEPGTTLLLACGLMGLLAAQRKAGATRRG